MPTNFVQPGDVITLVAPSGGVVAGTPELIGSLFVIPMTTAAETEDFEAAATGVWTLAKTSAQAWTEGQKIYWDNGNSRCDSDSTVGILIGVAADVAANPSSTGVVRLNGVAPATSEGPQATIADLTDSTGLSGTHDDTLAATAPLVTLTDNTGLGTHDDTLAATTLPTTLTDNTGLNGTHDDTLAATTVPAALTGGESPTEAEHNAVLTLLGVMVQNASDTAQKIIEHNALIGVMIQNQADVAQKIIEIIAQIAVTNQNVSDTAQKVKELRTAMIAYGVIAAA